MQTKPLYINADDKLVEAAGKKIPTVTRYTQLSCGDLEVKRPKVSIEGVSFRLLNKDVSLNLKSHLLGLHQIGPLAASAQLGLELGLNSKMIEIGIQKTTPFEHRLQPRHLAGAWLIDDTYNGNFDGIRVGLELMNELTAKRKVYVTPGLVEQGSATKQVHTQIGALIAKGKPDLVILIKNSVSDYIQAGLKSSNYTGEVRIEDNPKRFYENLDSFVAVGDLVLLQNDWPDNYN